MKVWFITGASRGFGALITEKALQQGDAVIATARKPADVVARFGDHPNLLATRLDVTREQDAIDAVAAGVERFGHIDILVNNAGYGLLGAVEESSSQEVENVYATNVFGLLKVTRAVLPHMRQRRSGHIINISSIGGYDAFTGWGVYGSTKFAVEGLSDAMYIELKPLGINVTVVQPGFFRTDFLDEQSLISTKVIIDDYADTVGAMRSFAADANHAQPGDPTRLADAFITLANAEHPPRRLPLGSDTVAQIGIKHEHVNADLNAWESVARSTDFQS